MGKVYLARDNGGNPAAVKVLRRELTYDAEMAKRFVREARAAVAVQSRGVARVLDADVETGRPWIATEFLAGPTLDEAVSRYGPFEDSSIRELGAALAATISQIHAVGLVHRDVKPSNVVLTSSGPRLIDFGIARPEHGLTLTTTGQAPVTPGFGPPEQVLGHRVGPSADVFALGAVLSYAATGERAFAGSHIAAVQYEVVHGEPRIDSLSRGLRATIAPCLAKHTEARPTPEQVAAALAPLRRAKNVWREGALAADVQERVRLAAKYVALPASSDTASDEVRGVSRRRWVAGAVGGVAIAVAGSFGAWRWLGETADEEEQPWAAKPLSEYERGTPPRPLWGPIQTSSTSGSGLLSIRDIVVLMESSGRLCAYDVRDGRRRWQTEGVEPDAQLLAVSSPASVASVTSDGELILIDARTGALRWRVAANFEEVLTASPDVVYGITRDGKVRAVTLNSRESQWTVTSPVPISAAKSTAAVGADGILILHGTNGRVAGIHARTGRTMWVGKNGDGGVPAGHPAVGIESAFFGGPKLSAVSVTDGHEQWAHPSSSESGWGAPTFHKQMLYATDGLSMKSRRAGDGSGAWTLPLESELPKKAPVIHRNSAWVSLDEDGKDGVAAVDIHTGRQAWSYVQGTSGRWQIAAAGNRVFLLKGGLLTAMPVF